MADSRDDLRPALENAQRALEQALEEACGTDLRTADTGELIRMDETLAAASRAAKDAVSLRLKLRTQRRSGPGAEAPTSRERAKGSAAEHHRVITDPSGTSWAVFAVYPSARNAERGLPDGYGEGWLTFEHGDEIRRLAPVPADWQSLPENELQALWEKAEPAARRITNLRPPRESGS